MIALLVALGLLGLACAAVLVAIALGAAELDDSELDPWECPDEVETW